MNSRTILRGGATAAAALTTTAFAASAAQAHASRAEPHRRNPGMQRMHELHMQGEPGMHAMTLHGHGR